jgi:hypothetical protein
MRKHKKDRPYTYEHSLMKILIAIAILVPLTASCATPSKPELDAEVRRLCAVDGGIRVYEQATFSSSKLDEKGDVRIPAKRYASARDEYYFESERLFYRNGNPEMWRYEYRIVRARDKKVMGTSVIYTRRGGDLPSPMHDSSFSCPDDQPSLEKSIFVIGK